MEIHESFLPLVKDDACTINDTHEFVDDLCERIRTSVYKHLAEGEDLEKNLIWKKVAFDLKDYQRLEDISLCDEKCQLIWEVIKDDDKWTDIDDQRLRSFIEENGIFSWQFIADNMFKKWTPTQCQERWNYLLQNQSNQNCHQQPLNKNHSDEDFLFTRLPLCETIINSIPQKFNENFTLSYQIVPTPKAVTCRKKYWTWKEKEKLYGLVAKYGSQDWQMIANLMQNKWTSIECYDQWVKLSPLYSMVKKISACKKRQQLQQEDQLQNQLNLIQRNEFWKTVLNTSL